MTADAAFDQAREECIAQNYMKNFINKEDFIMFYKDFLDYDTQLLKEGEARGEARGETRGAEKTISIAIQNNVPLLAIEAMAKEANITRHRLDELLAQVAV